MNVHASIRESARKVWRDEGQKVVVMVTIQGGYTGGVYRSYLVRFWQSNEQGSWRASAQCVQTGNTVLFGSVERLLAFLQTEIGATPATAADNSRSPAPQGPP